MASNAEQGPVRLSAWLSARVAGAEDYPLGLLWLVPEEKPAQLKMRSDLLQSLSRSQGDAAAITRLSAWVASLPVTGRVPVSIVDADWLAVHPKHDPLILETHQLVLPRRPHTVTLMSSKGLRCQLEHVSGGMVKDYWTACVPQDAHQVDWAWLVQPDGKIKKLGIASWNLQKQEELAPGAWLWLPYREDRWTDDFSDQLAAFLATQGVAAETPANPSGAVLPMPEVGQRELVADSTVTANDWGGAGLLQTPSARMRESGNVAITLSHSDPYSHLNVFLQPFDWFELGFRYTDISNRLYGPSIAGSQTYKDKSIDVKFGLFDESAYLPQIALGMRDITGTGFFSGEYLVANKRAGAFDWSLGMGWGYLGGRGNINNPFALLNQSYSTRTLDVGEGGNFSLNSYFRGRAAMFGGVQYQSPWEPLILKLEYDGNDYQHERDARNLPQYSPWNAGAVYRAGKGFNVSLGFERGNTLMLGFTLQTDLAKLSMPKLHDPAPVAVSEFRPQRSAIAKSTGVDLARQADWFVRSIEQRGPELRVNVDDAETLYWRQNMNRANAVLHRDAADDVDFFSYVYRHYDADIVVHRVDRSAWVRQQTQPLPLSMQSDAVSRFQIEPASKTGEASSPIFSQSPAIFEAEPWLHLNYNLGGPDGFILYQLTAQGQAKLRIRDDTWLQGAVELGLLDNYDTFQYTAPSNLPRVRTYLREYMTSSKVKMPNLQITHTGKLSDNQYYSVYAGYLESMFAGFGSEWLYRQLDSPVALGIDVNRVQQRDFMQNFGLRDYRVDTGHATLYWDTGWNDILSTLSAGRYLAGDTGMTFELSRVFQNGVHFGGYFTKTNVSAAQFGEGSFDKGLYVSIPLDAMLTKSSNKIGSFAYKPLIRDGGAKLGRAHSLFGMTRLLDRRSLQYRPADPEGSIPVPSQRQFEWE